MRKILLLIALCFFSCDPKVKTTQVSGIITSASTGQPVPGITVAYIGYHGHKQDATTSLVYDEAYTISDSNGYYSVEVSGSSAGFSMLTGYCNKYFDIEYHGNIELGKSNETNMVLDMIDGKVILVCKNITGATKADLEIDVNCKRTNKVAGCCHPDLKINSSLGRVDSLRIPVSANRDIQVSWKNNVTNQRDTASVFCAENGKAYLLVEY
jgi:hypothetical protein